MLIKDKFVASESCHFYDKDGNPQYSVIAKNGESRPSTLRDCRKNNWLPSVTTILNILDKPGLNSWKQNQTIDAALTLPRIEGESADSFKVRVIQDAKEHANQAMNLGTAIHTSLDKAYSGLPYDPEHEIYVKSVQEAIFMKYGQQAWFAERSFAHKSGYGGKIDLACESIVIDFKTTAFDAEKARKGQVGGYNEHLMQLAAYAQGLMMFNPTLANVYVSTSVPGLVHIVEYSPDDSCRGISMFDLALRIWQLQKNYKP